MNIQNIHLLTIIDKSSKALITRSTKTFNLKEIHPKINNNENIALINENLVVYKNIEDICIILISDLNTNEIFLSKALDVFYAALLKILKSSVNKETIIKNYDLVVLLVDAFVYQGILIEDDVDKLVKEVGERSYEGLEGMKIPKGFASIFSKASSKFKK